MTHTTEIIITVDNQQFTLDTTDVESFPITYNINDINSFSNNRASYSKTIKLPLTSRNQDAFQYINNIYSANNDTNQYKSLLNRVKCVVYRNSIKVLDGVMEYNQSDNINKEIEITIFDDNGDLWKSIEGLYLNDLDYSRFDHTLGPGSYSNYLTQSWTSDYKNGYYYGRIDWGSNFNSNPRKKQFIGDSVNDYKPSWYIKPIIYQIFNENGYSIESNFMNSSIFQNLLVTDGNINKYEYACQFSVVGNNAGWAFPYDAYKNTTAGWNSVSGGSGKLLYKISAGNFACDTNDIDPNNEYQATATYSFFNKDNSTKSFIVNYDINYTEAQLNRYGVKITPGYEFIDTTNLTAELEIFCLRTGTTNFGNNTIFAWQFENYTGFNSITFGGFKSGIDSNATTTVIGTATASYTTSDSQILYNTTTKNTKGRIQFDMTYLQPNEEVKFFWSIKWYADKTDSLFDTTKVTYRNTLIANTHVLQNLINLGSARLSASIVKIFSTTSSTGNINASLSLPRNIKQTDFINSIFKAFNLRIAPSKTSHSTFIIEPLDTYYSLGTKINDWSQKIDLSKSIYSSLLSSQQKKYQYFTYKEDKDYWNNTYKTQTNKIYGEWRQTIDNYYLNDENKIELIFSPTIMNEFFPTSFTLPQYSFGPMIWDANPPTKPISINCRLLTRNTNNLRLNTSYTFESITYSFYPYVGHTDHPTNPTYDLNFAPVDGEYITSTYSQTDSNLFNTYWGNFISSISDPDSKILTLSLYLTEMDINQFNFNDLIYLEFDGGGSYWRVNRIVNYDPIRDDSTEVELISAYDYKIRPGQIYQPGVNSGGNGNPISNPPSSWLLTPGNVSTSTSNSISSTNNVVNGVGNNVSSSNTIINGNNNSSS